ncbi:MAG: c-type cytochrome [Gammaproteobacteria bacterium]|nr:c-type cytochrome [Gammaproteobacteria bacterium]
MNRDQKFFDMYSLVIGVLAIIALLIFVGVMKLSDLTQGVYTADTAEYQAAVADRIRPLGQVYMPGEEAAAGDPVVSQAPATEPVATVLSGPQVYNEACIACHGSGVGGAPVISDPAAWEARIAQGTDTLYQHAIEGYTGQFGYMPPKGARLDLSDDEVKGAVDFMVSEAGN